MNFMRDSHGFEDLVKRKVFESEVTVRRVMQNLLNLHTQSLQLGAMRLEVEEGEITVQRHFWRCMSASGHLVRPVTAAIRWGESWHVVDVGQHTAVKVRLNLLLTHLNDNRSLGLI